MPFLDANCRVEADYRQPGRIAKRFRRTAGFRGGYDARGMEAGKALYQNGSTRVYPRTHNEKTNAKKFDNNDLVSTDQKGDNENNSKREAMKSEVNQILI